MYKLFGSKEVFNDNLEEISPIKMREIHNAKKKFSEKE